MGPVLWLALIGVAYWWGRHGRPSHQETSSGLQPDVRDAFPRCVPEERGAHQDTQLLPFARPRWMDDV